MQSDKKNLILVLYYEQHLLAARIATIIGVSSQYVSKIVKDDPRYRNEKDSRKQINHTNYIKRKIEAIKKKREIEMRERHRDKLMLKRMHNQDVSTLSKYNMKRELDIKNRDY